MLEIHKYRDENGRIPFDTWLAKLTDERAKAKILARLRRLLAGNEGDWKTVGEGIRELRITEGKGYRVYYAWHGNTIVLLLCGGDKSTQERDIALAKTYWRNYRE